MKLRTLLALFGLIIALFTVMGCDNNDDENNFAVSGTVVAAATGDPVTGPLTVRAVNDGIVFADATTSTGAFTVSDLPRGQYLLYVAEQGSDTEFVFGPVSVPASGAVDVPIPAPPAGPVGAGNGVLAFSFFDNQGDPVPVTVNVNGDIRTGTNVFYELPAGDYSFTVEANGTTTTYQNITVTANKSLVIVQGNAGNNPPPTGPGTLTGTVVNDRSDVAVTNPVIIRLYQNGQPVLTQIEVTNGQFTITDIPVGTYELVLRGNGYVTTVYGPVVIQSGANGPIQVRTMTVSQAQTILPAVQQPNDNTGTLIVSATDQAGAFTLVGVNIDDIISNTNVAPLAFTGLDDPDQTYNVQLTLGSNVLNMVDVPIPDNQITLIARRVPSGT